PANSSQTCSCPTPTRSVSEAIPLNLKGVNSLKSQSRNRIHGSPDENRRLLWIDRPMTTQDAERLLEPFRQYLTVLAELHLDRKLRGKLDASDVVQQTMLRAYPALAEVRDTRPEVLVAWLRRILARTLADVARHYERDKRDVALERSME